MWKEEAALIPAFYDRFGERLPQALWDQFDALMERLGEAAPQRAQASARIAQKVVSPA